MPVYEYLAINKSGKNEKVSLEADSLRAARQKLRGQGMYPTEIKESLKAARSGAAARDVRRIFQSDKVKIGELSIATRQLATLVSAGLPLVAALQALTDQVESVVLKRIITRVRESVQEGESFSKAIGAFPKTFPRLYINLVGAGEASGTLGMVLDNLADYLEAQQELKRKVWSALTYPIIMMLICVLVVIFLLTFVVPQIVEIFKKQGAQLPLPTQITLSLSDF